MSFSPSDLVDLTQPLVPPTAAVPIPKVSQFIDLSAEDEDAVSDDEKDEQPNTMDLDFIDDRPESELSVEPNGRMSRYADIRYDDPEGIFMDSQGSYFDCTCEGWMDGQHATFCPEYQLWANHDSESD